jgi:EAL domain-containing protein (putative c-di-GMP-specific phosphodiesterase class I)
MGLDQAVKDKAAFLHDLARALPDEQLEVHYQPIISLADGSVDSYEALLRWRHPTRGLVPPLEFIPLAEDTGHILAIGQWVLQTAATQAAEWSRRLGRPVDVAVNLSPRQLADDRILATVQECLATAGLPACQLTLEVTEGVLVRDIDIVAGRLQKVRELGVRIAIDDFGTGYSSLSYLQSLPVDIVKIDRSFISDLAVSEVALRLVSSIVALGRSLCLDVVAEGVETKQQADALRKLACPSAQGYLFARPLPADSILTGLPPASIPAPTRSRELEQQPAATR